MSKKTKIWIVVIIVVFVSLILFVPIIPNKYVYQTKLQKEDAQKFCEQHGCGLYMMLTPYQYVINYYNNFTK